MRYADDSCRSALLQRLLPLREREPYSAALDMRFASETQPDQSDPQCHSKPTRKPWLQGVVSFKSLYCSNRRAIFPESCCFTAASNVAFSSAVYRSQESFCSNPFSRALRHGSSPPHAIRFAVSTLKTTVLNTL